METIKLYMLDDHQLFLDLLTERLLMEENFEIVGSSNTSSVALNDIEKLRPNIILLDISLPDISGIEFTKLIKKYSPLTKIIGVSMHSQIAYIKGITNNGAMGYVTKSSPFKEILTAIYEVHKGKRYLCESIKRELAENTLFDNGEDDVSKIKQLTMREIEIIKLVREGKSSIQIGQELNVSPKTVEVHRHNILKKLKVKNTIELIFVTNDHLL